MHIEFEYKSSHFKRHGHLKRMNEGIKCDMIVCWEHDWVECPEGIEVLELKTEYLNYPNEENESTEDVIERTKPIIEEQLNNYPEKVQKLFKLFDKNLKGLSREIWTKAMKNDGVTYYSPEKVFIYLNFQKQGLMMHLFTNGKEMKGVEVTTNINGKSGKKWGKVYLKEANEMKKTILIIKESLSRMKEAIKNKESTFYHAEIEDK